MDFISTKYLKFIHIHTDHHFIDEEEIKSTNAYAAHCIVTKKKKSLARSKTPTLWDVYFIPEQDLGIVAIPSSMSTGRDHEPACLIDV